VTGLLAIATAGRDILDPDDLRAISRHAVTRRYPAKAVVVSEGDRSDGLFIVLEGRVKAFVSDGSGRTAELSVMGPGEYFGEVALDEGPRSATVMTLEPCVLSIVPRGDFDEFLVANPAFAALFVRRLIGRIRALTDGVRSLALMGSCERVVRLLQDSAVMEEGDHLVTRRLTHAEIAGRVGCSREMVSRVFKDLVQGGYITMRPDRIEIHRLPAARG